MKHKHPNFQTTGIRNSTRGKLHTFSPVARFNYFSVSLESAAIDRRLSDARYSSERNGSVSRSLDSNRIETDRSSGRIRTKARRETNHVAITRTEEKKKQKRRQQSRAKLRNARAANCARLVPRRAVNRVITLLFRCEGYRCSTRGFASIRTLDEKWIRARREPNL